MTNHANDDKQNTSAPVKEFTKFSNELDQALQMEVLRRKSLQKSQAKADRGRFWGCTSFIDRDSSIQRDLISDIACEQHQELAEVLEDASDNKKQQGETPEASGKDQLKKAKIQSILSNIEQYLPKALINKSDVCKHDHGCFENVFRHALKNFLVGFCLQMFIKNVFLLAKPAKMLKNL